jgi:hypothetical protein
VAMVAGGVGQGARKSEGRRSKSEGRPKSEGRKRLDAAGCGLTWSRLGSELLQADCVPKLHACSINLPASSPQPNL